MKNKNLMDRLKQFALEVVLYCRSIPSNQETSILKKQLISSATSAAANYRAASCGRSRREWYSKVSITTEEIDESHFWLSFIKELNYPEKEKLIQLIEEALQLTKIFNKIRISAKANDRKENSEKDSY